VPFPLHEPSWAEALAFLRRQAAPTDPILAPGDFLDFFSGAYHYFTAGRFAPEHFRFVVLHLRMLDELPPGLLRHVVRRFQPVFANDDFVIYRRDVSFWSRRVRPQRLKPLMSRLRRLAEPEPRRLKAVTAVCVTTYNRPSALERSLAQVVALGAPVLVVDDGSDADAARANRDIAGRLDAALLALPTNRGLACANNAGLAYWLADPEVEWISVFQDDVDVRPDALEVLARVQDADSRPILTGRYAAEHPVHGRGVVAGHEVLYQRSTRGTHLHAHRAYWEQVLPIPTEYLGAPKRDRGRAGQGSDEDWWVTAWAPRSVAKRGGYVTCVPGLVRHFAHREEESTWVGAAEESPDAEFTP
jgi:hypothetical protein